MNITLTISTEPNAHGRYEISTGDANWHAAGSVSDPREAVEWATRQHSGRSGSPTAHSKGGAVLMCARSGVPAAPVGGSDWTEKQGVVS